jgi:hypothetical protein
MISMDMVPRGALSWFGQLAYQRASVTVVNKFRNGTIRSASAYENDMIKNFV